MKVTPWVIAIAAIGLAIVAGQFGRVQYRRAARFEAQARLALDHEHVAQIKVDLMTDKVTGLQRDLAKRHAATSVLTNAVVATDLQHAPDTSCAPNLAARDAVIESQQAEIVDLHGIVAAQDTSIHLLQASKDELSHALQARPKLYPRFVGPNIGLGVFVGAVGLRPDGKPEIGVGVGITINVFSVRF
jgi:hypothetical protein